MRPSARAGQAPTQTKPGDVPAPKAGDVWAKTSADPTQDSVSEYSAFAVEERIEFDAKGKRVKARYVPVRLEIRDGALVERIQLHDECTSRAMAYSYLEGDVTRHYAEITLEEARKDDPAETEGKP